MRITPYMQDLQLYAGQEDNFECAVASLSKYLRISSSSSQMVRLVHHYGSDLETESSSMIADQIEQVP